MAETLSLKPNHKAVKQYYAAFDTYSRQDVGHEGAVSTAFQSLLDHCGQKIGWTLIPQQPLDIKGRKIRPDGTFQDDYYMKRGFWEAKDTRDKLESEIQKKIAQGYPLTNIVFEDTQQACLYQNNTQVMIADLTDPQKMCDLLNAFFAWTEPAHEGLTKAIEEFKERVPDLARGLVEKLQAAHKSNQRFIAAFDKFHALCRSSLNPNLSVAAINEMLVQHLLTERLIRTIFDAGDSRERNVVAREIEKVIAALTSESFSRHDFLQSLDRSYLAIEHAAATITDFSEKQHFLNTVYERFFQGYSVKVADTHGIVYTPQEIVDFMCASVEQVLKAEFGKRLGSPGVNILDPCTGTGNFVVNLLRRVSKRDLPRMYNQHLFANEVMLLPYYIAALNIEHAYWEKTGTYEAFEGLCFVDTLDLVEKQQQTVKRQRNSPITVVIGNPPYNMRQQDENDDNKNRSYEDVDRRIKTTYAKDSQASLKHQLYDPYVKFFRWATDRLNDRDGIVCFVTNNSFVEQIAFDGMRKNLLEDFTRVYHIDLHGNVRENPKLSGTTHNVFGIQVGVGITVAVRRARHRNRKLFYHRVGETWRKEKKLQWLTNHGTIEHIDWQQLDPDDRNSWIVPEGADEFARCLPLGSRVGKASKAGQAETIFKLYSLGVNTSRDSWVFDSSSKLLSDKMRRFIKNYNSEVFRLSQEEPAPTNIDQFINNDPKFLKWTDRLKEALERGEMLDFDEARIRSASYRPFALSHLYFDHLLNQRRYQQHVIFPVSATESQNRTICLSGSGHDVFYVLMTDRIPEYKFSNSANGGTQSFPFYVYDEDGGNRRENITDWALAQFQARCGDASISKWDIFYYVYGLLHHEGYREKFADNLKRELPRIPLAPDFRGFADAGRQLADLHLNYEQLEPHPLEWIESPDVPLSYRVEKMRLSKDKTSLVVNDSLTLAGIPPAVFDYRLGNRCALEWVIDQYRIGTDKRSGITSDPNRQDDPEYIVRLVGQVVRVSVESVEIVSSLPKAFADSPKASRKKKHK